MQSSLLEYVVDLVLPESQCGFLRGHNTIDMIFDTNGIRYSHSRPSLEYSSQICLSSKLSHTGICAHVVMTGSQYSSFPVNVGVKQGCVLTRSLATCS